MNDYIKLLKDQDKLNISIDKTKTFNWEYTKIAGPCSVEGPDIIDIAKNIKSLGANAFRAGAYKPCTYPILQEKNGWKEGLRDDFQNYTLLDALGKCNTPILLKRGTWGTIDEILGACERILVGGNDNIAICLRGVVGMPSYRHVFPSTRWAPDLMMIPALKELTNIPIIYDPSHSTGYRNFVKPISRAAMAAGADGLIIESHPRPEESISDPDQAINYETLREIFNG